jgi:hypothetical protein
MMLGSGPRADLTPKEEASARKNMVLGTGITARLLDDCADDPADILAVLTIAVGTILAGFDDEAQRVLLADKLKDGALHFVRGAGL